MVYAGNSTQVAGSTDFNKISIYNQASNSTTIPTFGVVSVTTNGMTRRLVQKSGELEIKGLYAYMHVIGHELGHNADHTAGFEISGGPLAGDSDPDTNGKPTGDGLLDAWEVRNNFDPMNADTTGLYGGPAVHDGSTDDGKGDRECCADIFALGYLVAANNVNAWRLDWAQRGLQWGSRPPIAMAPPYFPWTFRTYNPATMTTGPDQANLSGNVLTSVSQLDGGGM